MQSQLYNTFIRRHLPRCLSPYPPCGAEPRIELGPALQQADALPTEPRRTIKPRRTIGITFTILEKKTLDCRDLSLSVAFFLHDMDW
jgi:hypothetical protein